MNFILLCLLFPTISLTLYHELANFRDEQLNRNISQLQKAMQERGISVARSLALVAEQAIAGYDYTFLTDLMTQVVNNDPDISYILVMDPERRTIAHHNIDQVGAIQNDQLSKQAQVLMLKNFPPQPAVSAPEFISFLGEKGLTDGIPAQAVFEIVVPIHNGLQVVGALRCGVSLTGLTTQTDQTRSDWAIKMRQFKTFVLSMTGFFFLVGFLVAYVFTNFFVKSTTILSQGVHQVASGDLDVNIETGRMFCSEFENYATAFNEMTHQLRASLSTLDEYNKSLEDKVQARTNALHAAQTELLHKAHEAGMAEMAVGVLHNIGNAITPAKVETSLLQRRLRDSPILTKLPAAIKKIQTALEQPDRLAEAEKKRLIEICRFLPASIQEVNDMALGELQKISGKHEHIEEIINLQMRYARLLGTYEEVDINQMVQDALKMLNDSISRRFIQLELSLGKIPPVRIEKAKMIQIIINLVKNGYEAMDDPTLPQRSLRISTSVTEETPPMVKVSVKDTGYGFSKAERANMFQFGYTTKATGSGFGLHSCANFLIANRGTLTAASEGKGQGAEFVIQLPVSG